jgi:hypothetical protein
MITPRSLYFFVALFSFLISIVGIGTYYYVNNRRRRLYPYGNWDELIERIVPIDHQSLERIAATSAAAADFPVAGNFAPGPHLQPAYVEPADPEAIWQTLGGMPGIDVMEKNCAVLVDLVFYVQQWYPEALLIAEQLRLNAREVEWHIGRIRAAAKSGRPPATEYLQQAAAIYYRMACEVLNLYEQAHLPGLADLQRAI